ncbi:hypothetical protein BJ742DRAFT_744405 [Cladochytrium replicatum]|nr:hypothetical protein BJ742DRAFT_744405 [Cladochytrium replicatum]
MEKGHSIDGAIEANDEVSPSINKTVHQTRSDAPRSITDPTTFVQTLEGKRATTNKEIFDINDITMVLKRRETSDTDANFSGLDYPPYAITLIKEYTSIDEQLMIEQPADECIELLIEEFGDESFAKAEDPIAVSRINNPVYSPLDIFDINSIVAVLEQEQQYEPSENNGSESGLAVQPTTITLISETRSPNTPTFNEPVVMSLLNHIPISRLHKIALLAIGNNNADIRISLMNLGGSCVLVMAFSVGDPKAILVNGFQNYAITTTGPSNSEAYTILRMMTKGSNVHEFHHGVCWRLMTASKKFNRAAILNMTESLSPSKSVASALTNLPFDQDDNITVDQRSEIAFGRNTNLLVSAKNCLIGEGVGGGGTGISERNLPWGWSNLPHQNERTGGWEGSLWQVGLPETTPMIKIARKSFNIPCPITALGSILNSDLEGSGW